MKHHTTHSISKTSTSALLFFKRGKVVLLLLLLISFLPDGLSQSTNWYNQSWLYRKAITIDYTKVSAGTHSNFPVLISTADAALQAKAQANGNDILFTSSDGTTKLDHEIESYTSASGTLVAWVKIPSLSSVANTIIYMYYGNAAASSQQNITGTWSSNYSGVYHLNNVFTDATSNVRNGTNTGTFDMPGKISRCRGFNPNDGGADYITISGLMGSPANFTLSAWANLTSADINGGEVISLGDHSMLRYDATNGKTNGITQVGASSWAATPSSTNYTTGWRYVTYTFNDAGNVQQVYVDGQPNGAATTHGASPYYAGGGTNTFIGKHGNGNIYMDFYGSIDEVRVSSAVRSAGWILTEYNNQNNPSAFYSVGAEQTCNTAAPVVVSPVTYCQNATASQLTATGSNLLWGWGAVSGSAGGTSSLTGTVWVDNAGANFKTSFTTTRNNVTITSVDYYIPMWQSVTSLVLGIFNSSGTKIATSSATTTQTAGGTGIKVTATFNYNIATAGDYSIGISSGSGVIGFDSPSFPITESTGTINVTGVTAAGKRNFNNIQFTSPSGSSSTAPTPGTAYAGTTNYTVTQTVSGCTSPAATVSVVVNTTPSLVSVPTSGLALQYNFSNSATDASGTGNPGSLQGAPTVTADRNSNSLSAYSFNGTSQFVTTTTYYENPVNFTYVAWFKTTTNSGGRIIGFGNSQNGLSSQSDRLVYMTNSGQLYFGVYPNATKTINTTASYNDGQWHQVVASLSSTNGMKLYVDGSLKASDPTVVSAQNYNGWIKVGYDNITGWVNVPSSFYFNGTLDDILAYTRELTENEITTLYNNGSGASSNAPVCTGQTLNLTATSITGATYSWTGPNGFTSNEQNPSISDVASAYAGTYTVTATVSGCSTTGSVVVTLQSAPSATISYSGTPFCTSSTSETVTYSGSTGGTYSSTAGLNINASTGTINPSASTPGTYTVTYTIAGSGVCGVYTTTTSVTIVTQASASVSIASDLGATVCSGSTVTFTATPTNGGSSPSYQWKLNGVNVGANSTTYTTSTLSNNDVVSCVLTSNYSCISGSSTVSSNTLTMSITLTGTWLGGTSTSWNTASNWSCSTVPTASTDVIIPSGTNYSPLLTGSASVCRNLTIQSGATITLGSDARLAIAGSISNGGTFEGSAGVIELNGSSAQTIPAGAFANNLLKGLTINNTAGVSLSGALSLTDVLTISGGSLASNGYLTLKSSATATARIATITSVAATPISGNVTVERYVPGRRKYRLITSPVTTSANASLTTGEEALSIWGNWQNSGVNTTPNAGNFITGGSSADGFDTQTTNASLFTYDDVNRRYTSFTSANGKNTKYTPLKAGVAYYMFVYGDRRNTVFTSSPNNTVLSATGTLKTGDQVYTFNSSIPLSNVVGRFTLLGNPYASPIDWATIQRTDISNTMWGWDPNLSNTGGYVTVTTSGTVTLTAPYSGSVGLDQYIQSGQGFYVKTTGTSPSLTIREQDKVGNFNANAFRTFGRRTTASASRLTNDIPLIAINLQYETAGTKVLADGVLAAFDATFSKEVGAEDATKMANSAEALSIINGNDLLSIDGRRLPTTKDTLYLNTVKLTKAQYTLQVFTKKMGGDMQVFLEDSYRNTSQQLVLNDTNTVVFNVVASEPLSSATNRFKIVFAPTVALPVKFVSVKAAEKNAGVQVEWSVGEQSGIEKYEVERSADGVHFNKISEVPVAGNITHAYQWTDASPVGGNNYYRIRAIEDGRSYLSKVVVVSMQEGKAAVKVSPNPVREGQINLQLMQLQKGKYTLQLVNVQGQLIHREMVEHAGGSSTLILHPKKLAAGVYYLQLANESSRYEQKVFVE